MLLLISNLLILNLFMYPKAAIGGRLLDHDDKVRTEAVNVVCELAKTNLSHISSYLITQAAERLRDKKVSFS